MDPLLTLGLILALALVAFAIVTHFALKANRYWMIALIGRVGQSVLRRSDRLVIAYTLYFFVMLVVAVFMLLVAAGFYAIATLVTSDLLRSMARLLQYVFGVAAVGQVALSIKGMAFLRSDIGAGQDARAESS